MGREVRDPVRMRASEINAELDRLEQRSTKLNQALIAAGRGHELTSEVLGKGDKLSREFAEMFERRLDLRREIARRFGPNAPSRLPRGFGPTRGRGDD